MRIFLAGATGVIGVQLVPLLVGAGHEVVGMTRSPGRAEAVAALGATPVVCDVYDVPTLRAAVANAAPDLVMHQLTDLPDDAARIGDHRASNNRIRREGTQNLLNAAAAAGTTRFVAQSVAWALDGDGGAAIEEHERAVLAFGGVVVRYGQLYGPGTWAPSGPLPPHPRVHVAEAALGTMPALSAPGGTILTVVEPA